MIGCSDKNHRFVAPQALTKIKFRLLVSGKIYDPGGAVPTWELSCFTHIFKPGPKKLSEYVIVTVNSLPCFKAHPVFTPVNDTLRIFLMISSIAEFLIIISGHIKRSGITRFIRH